MKKIFFLCPVMLLSVHATRTMQTGKETSKVTCSATCTAQKDSVPLQIIDERLHDAQSARAVKDLLSLGIPVDLRNEQGETPLHCARSEEIARELLAAGANPNARDNMGNCPIHHALDGKIAQALISYGASVNAVNNLGLTPFEAQADNSQVSLVLLRNNARITLKKNPYLRVVFLLRDNARAIRRRNPYLEHEAKIRELVEDPFLAACFVGNVDYIRQALAGKTQREKRFFVNRCSSISSGITPLQAAVSQGHIQVIRLLVSSTPVTQEHIKIARNYHYWNIARLLTRIYEHRQALLHNPSQALLPQAPSRSELLIEPSVTPPVIVELGHVGRQAGRVVQPASLSSTCVQLISESRATPARPALSNASSTASSTATSIISAFLLSGKLPAIEFISGK